MPDRLGRGNVDSGTNTHIVLPASSRVVLQAEGVSKPDFHSRPGAHLEESLCLA